MSKKSSKRRGCLLPFLLVLIVCVLAGWLLWSALRPVSPSSSESQGAAPSAPVSWRDRIPSITEAPSIFFPKLEPLPSPPVATPPPPLPAAPQPAPQRTRIPQASEATRAPAAASRTESPAPVRRTPPPSTATVPSTPRTPPPAATPSPVPVPAPATPPPAFPASTLGGRFFVVRDKVSRPSGYYLICTRDGENGDNRYGFRVSIAEFSRASDGMLYDSRNMRDWEPVSRIE